jgi:hypothetical protein
MDYRVKREKDRMVLSCWNYHYPLRFVLRTQKEIDRVTGGRCQKIGDDAYLIETEDSSTVIEWKEPEK